MLKLSIMLKLLISLQLTLCCYHPMLDAFFFKTPIWVTPGKYWYPVGSSVEIYCETKDKGGDNLYFSDLNPTVPLQSTNYTVKVIDKTTILLQQHNVSAGKYNYVCQSNRTERKLLDIGVASFEVGYPPEIKDIQFESIDLKQLSVFVTPKIVGINEYWKTSWQLGENSTEDPMKDECHCLNPSQSCLCEDPFNCTIFGESCFNQNQTYQLTILGSNHFGLLNKTYLISPTLEILKLKELKNLETFVGVSSISLSWSWKLQDLWPSNVVECRVSYKPQNGEWNSSMGFGNKMTFRNLEPNTRYTFALQCRFQGSEYWSDGITVHESTLSAPNISIENLKIIDVTDSDVVLSWQSRPVDSNISHYLVTYKAENSPEEFTVLLPSQEFKLKNLNSSTHYTLAVAICNSNGCSRKKSHIQFTTKKTGLCSQLKLTSLSKNLLHVNWTDQSRKLFHFNIGKKTHFLASTKEFTLEVPCPKHNFPLKLGVQTISEHVKNMINICKMNIKEVTMCQNSVFGPININTLPQISPSVSGNK